jgi:pimeloyl-ACP methyl ester carboxylesterase
MNQNPAVDIRNPGLDGSLHAVRYGDPSARVLVFLHGITGSRRYWEKRVMQLGRKYRVIIPDLLGFGLSPKPRIDYTMAAFVSSLRAFLEAEGLGERRVTLVGHSLGALIGVEYAIAYSEQVESMVLLNLPWHESADEAHRLFWLGSPSYRKLLKEDSIVENISHIRRTGMDLFLRYVVRFPWSVLADSRKFTMNSLTSTIDHCLLNYRVQEVLPRLTPRPLLLMHGVRDGVAPFEYIQSLAGTHPWMRLREIPASGHHVFLTHTRVCLRELEHFLGESTERTR